MGQGHVRKAAKSHSKRSTWTGQMGTSLDREPFAHDFG